MKNLLLRLFHGNRRFFFYCVIGGCGATLDFLIYFSLVRWGGGHYQIANAIGYASGTALSFVLNAKFNFKTGDWLALRLISFFSVAIVGWSASAGILYVTVTQMGWNKYLAKLLTIVVSALLQYNLNRMLSFRKISNDSPPNA
jgi:putative flippase GtrA